ncbi:hypothetical protein P3T35_003990 [Kitasatospora sp. GP30]|uniref:hypothetical protein n=1 Tax=Kitasatospora sp. GP30 TaxID=3035084 RepID=UPI000CBF299C|nr:hypothetical protein [Kitasatospora sp. GP30]MDH6141969.1 hypothetical protein [Kitasatospora sp. GP30]
MSVLTSFHALPKLSRPRSRSLRAAMAELLARFAASPLDSPVLRVARPQVPETPAPKMRAQWQAVTAVDGTTRLSCHWYADR